MKRSQQTQTIVPSTATLIELVHERSEDSTCDLSALTDYSIEQIGSLYHYGLLDKLTELPGIGIDEILDIEEILSNSTPALSTDRSWIYRLTLQVIRQSSLSAAIQLLPKLKDISASNHASIQRTFDSQFSQNEKVVLYRHYRNQQPLEDIAANYDVPLTTVRRAQRNLLAHLRRDQIQQMLVEAIFKTK